MHIQTNLSIKISQWWLIELSSRSIDCAGGRTYFSFWTHIPDDLLDRAMYIFRSHLNYHARLDGDVIYPFYHARPHFSPSLFFALHHRDTICITHATKMRFFASNSFINRAIFSLALYIIFDLLVTTCLVFVEIFDKSLLIHFNRVSHKNPRKLVSKIDSRKTQPISTWTRF